MDSKNQRLIDFFHLNAGKYDEISKKQRNRLQEINEAVEKLDNERINAHRLLKENAITISNIVKLLGCSNKTLYNNPILIDFCNYLIEKYKNEDKSYKSKYKNPDEMINSLVIERDSLVDKEVELLELKKRIKEFKEQINRNSIQRKKEVIQDELEMNVDFIKTSKSQ